jgi:hypothetical protein
VYAIPLEVVRHTRRGSLQLAVEAMAARAAWLVGELSQHESMGSGDTTFAASPGGWGDTTAAA